MASLSLVTTIIAVLLPLHCTFEKKKAASTTWVAAC
jgi:hypothetical protein